jgi:predicted PurR-regulated permease PerM
VSDFQGVENLDEEYASLLNASEIYSKQMDESQIKFANLNLVLASTDDVMGATADKMQTVEGQYRSLDKMVETFKLRMGEQNTMMIVLKNLYKQVNDAIKSFAVSLLKAVPKQVIEGMATLVSYAQDFAGVLLIVIGSVIKYGFYILVLVSSFKLLALVLSYTVGLTITFGGALTLILGVIAPIIVGIIAMASAFNDLYESSAAFKQFIDYFLPALDTTERKLNETSTTFDAISKAVKGLLQVLVNFAKFMITTVVQVVMAVQLAFYNLKKLFVSSEEDLLAYDMMLEDITNSLFAINATAREAGNSILNAFGFGTANAAESTNKLNGQMAVTDKLAKKLEFTSKAYRAEVERLSKVILKESDQEYERMKVVGTSIQVLMVEYKKLKKDVSEVYNENIGKKEAAKKVAEGELLVLKKSYEIEKARLDMVKKITDENKSMSLDIMKAEGKNIAAFKIERNEKLSAINDEIAALKTLGSLKQSEVDKLKESKSLINKIYDKKIYEEQGRFSKDAIAAEIILSDIKKLNARTSDKLVDELRQKQIARLTEISAKEDELRRNGNLGERARIALTEARLEAAKIVITGIDKLETQYLEELQKKNDEIQTSIDQATQTQVYNINRKYEAELELLKVKEEQLKAEGLLTDKIAGSIAAARGKLATQKGIELKTAPGESFEKLTMIGKDVAGSITQSFTEGATGMVAGAASIVSMVIEAIDVVLTAIPGFIDKVSQIFDKITNFPKVLFAAFDTLGRSITNFVENIGPQLAKFIPMIIESIVDLLIKLPDIMVAAIEKLPDLLIGMLDKIEILIPKLITGLIRAIPSIAKLFIFHLLQPYIWWTVAVMLTKAIINGLVESVNQIFSGTVMKMPDTKKFATELADGVKAATKTLSGEKELNDE